MAPDIKYTKIFINNKWVKSISGKKFKTFNPHDGSLNAEVSEGDKADVDAAVSAAKKAFHRNSEWRLLDASGRAKLLNKFADLVQRDLDYLVELETLDNGMVLKNNRLFMSGGIDIVRYNASWADKILGTTIPVDGEAFSYTMKQPVGVCALIIPWNAPILFFTNKVSTALAAGCTVVVKPAEQTPLTALALAALVAEAGFPPGVVNVVPGYGETAGAALTHHIDVAHVSFTGSVEVGKIIQRAAGTNNLKRVSLELGGKSPLVIMNDADLDAALQMAAFGVFTNQGQMCFAASRLFVQSGIYDEFVKRATKLARNLKIGNPTDLGTQQGPQVGKIIQRAAGTNNLKRVSLELGGKSPLVIMNDADLDAALEMAAFGVFTNQGQMCFAASRLFVQSGIYDKFVKRATKLARNLKIGNPTDLGAQQGPQVDKSMMEKVLGYINKGVSEGAKLEAGGKRVGNTGYYIEPTVFSNVTDDMTIAKEEIFGPVQSILKFETFEEVLERANASNFGLAAGIFTSSLETALQFSKHVEAGIVWVNTYLKYLPQLPFGGVKDSGIGRENGSNGVEAYLEVKTVTIALPKKI